MKVLKHITSRGNVALVAINREQWKLLKNVTSPEIISGFRVDVEVEDTRSPEENRTYHKLPMVILDLSTPVEVRKEHVQCTVCVLNVEAFHTKQVVYYYGIRDVFFIAQKKIANVLMSIGKDEFPFYRKDSLHIDKEIRLYQRKVDIIASIHKAMQSCHRRSVVITEPVCLPLEDFALLVKEVNGEYDTTHRYESVYTVLPMGQPEKSAVNKEFAVVTIKNVADFEKCFGFLSTFKYDININSINNLLHMNTTLGLSMSRCPENEGDFESLEWLFDIARGACRLSFKMSHRSPGDLAKYFQVNYKAWEQQFKDTWKEPPVIEPVVSMVVNNNNKRSTVESVSNPYMKIRKVNQRRSANVMNRDIVTAMLQNLLNVEDLDLATNGMHKDIRYIVSNLPKRPAETISLAFKDLMLQHPAANLNSIIEGLKVSLPEHLLLPTTSDVANESKVKSMKIECIGKYLQHCYDSFSTSSIHE